MRAKILTHIYINPLNTKHVSRIVSILSFSLVFTINTGNGRCVKEKKFNDVLTIKEAFFCRSTSESQNRLISVLFFGLLDGFHIL